jgi:RNA polymerase sigma-70 factor (ECF subfamily)
MDVEAATSTEWVRAALEEHEGPLLRYAAQITGDLDLARDVVQDTFLRLCHEDRARLDGHVAEWLFTVCRNRALDLRRKESRMKPLDETELETCASREPSPAALAEQHERASLVLRLLEALPPNQREVLRLKFQNGLSYAEISRVTQLTVTNVGFLIHTGLKTLRQRLKAEAGSIQ